jgi:3-deoxy-manno-octulosonate cytidylyltransferase (CMP-KDO synthetase)
LFRRELKKLKNTLPQIKKIKCQFNKEEELVYISRSIIPCPKNNKNKVNYFKQVCIYAFNKKELNIFSRLKNKSKIEKIEDIEILRFFDFGIKIKMVRLYGRSVAVDEIKDLKKVEDILNKK